MAFIVCGIKALRHFEEYLGVNVFVLACHCRCRFFGHVMSCLPRAEVGSGVRGVKRERPRKFHDRRISTAVTLSFKDTKEMQDCCAQQQKQVNNVFFGTLWIFYVVFMCGNF